MPCSILAPVLHEPDNTLNILRLVENLMSDLRVSQCSVIAERLQGTRTDAQLLADFLVVHSLVQGLLGKEFVHTV